MMTAYVVFTNVHNDTEVRDIDTAKNKVIACESDDGDENDPLSPYFGLVEEALELRRMGGTTGECYWQSFRLCFD